MLVIVEGNPCMQSICTVEKKTLPHASFEWVFPHPTWLANLRIQKLFHHCWWSGRMQPGHSHLLQKDSQGWHLWRILSRKKNHSSGDNRITGSQITFFPPKLYLLEVWGKIIAQQNSECKSISNSKRLTNSASIWTAGWSSTEIICRP